MWRLCLILASLSATALGQNVIPLQEKESDISSSIAPIVKAHHENPNDIITNKHLEEIRELFENNDVFKSKLDNILSKISNSITSQILSVVRSESDKEHVKIVEDVEQSGRRQQLNNEIRSTEAKELPSPQIQLITKEIIPVEESTIIKVNPIKVVNKLNHDENHVKKEKDKKLGLFDRVRTILGFRRVGQNNKKHESSEEAHNHRRSDTSVEQSKERILTTNLPIPILPNVIENDKQNVKDVNDVTQVRNIFRVLRDDITNQDKSVESQVLSVETNNLPTRRNVIENDKHDVSNGRNFFTALRGAVQATRSALADSRFRPRRMNKRDTALQPVLNIFSRLKQPIDKIVQEEKSIFGLRRSKKPEAEIPHNIQTSQRRSLIPIDIQSMRTHVNNTDPLDILVAKNNNPINRLFGRSNRHKRSPDFDDAVKAVQNAVVEYHKKQAKSVEQAQARLLSNIQAVKNAVADIRNNTRRSNIRDIDIAHSVVPSTEILHNNDPDDILFAKKDNPINRLFGRSNRQKRSPDFDDAVKAVKNVVDEYHKNQAKLVEQAQARIMRNIEAVKNSDVVKEVKNAVDEYHKKQAKSVEQAQARLLSNIQAVKNAVADIRSTRRTDIRDIDIAHSVVPSTEILHNNDPNDSLVAKKDNPISRLFNRSNRQKRSPDLDEAVKAVQNAVVEYHEKRAKSVEQAQARIMRDIEAVKNSDVVKEVKNAVDEYHKKQAKSVEQAQARLLSNIQAVKNAVADIRSTRRTDIRDIDIAHSVVPSAEIPKQDRSIFNLFSRSKRSRDVKIKEDTKPVFGRRRVNKPVGEIAHNVQTSQRRSLIPFDIQSKHDNDPDIFVAKKDNSLNRLFSRSNRQKRSPALDDAVKAVQNAVDEYHKKQPKSVEQAQARLLSNIQAVKNAAADIRSTRRTDIRDIDIAHSVVPSTEILHNNDPNDSLVAKKDNPISRLFNRSNRQKRSPDLDEAVKAVQNAVVEYHEKRAKSVEQAQARIMRDIEAVKNSDVVKEVKNAVDEYHKKQAKSVEQAQARLLSNIQAVKNAVADIRSTRRTDIRDIDIAHSVVPSAEIPKQDRSIFNLFSRSKRSRDVKIKEDTKPVFGRRRVNKPVGEIAHNVQTSQRRSLIPFDIQSKHDNDPDIFVAKKDNSLNRLFSRSNRQKRSPALDDAVKAVQNAVDEYHKKQPKSVEQAQARLLSNIQAVKNAAADIRDNTRKTDIRDIAAHSIVPSAESGKQDRSKFNLFIRSKRSRDLKVKVNNKPIFSRRRVNKPERDNVQPSKRQRLVHTNVNNDPHDILVAKKDNAISRLFNRSNRQKRSPAVFDDALEAVQNVADIEQNIDDILDLINNKPSEVFLDQVKMKKKSPKPLTNIIKTDELEEIFRDQQQEKLKGLIGKTLKTVISPLNIVSRALRRNSRSNRNKSVKEKILSYTITDHKVYDDYEI